MTNAMAVRGGRKIVVKRRRKELCGERRERDHATNKETILIFSASYHDTLIPTSLSFCSMCSATSSSNPFLHDASSAQPPSSGATPTLVPSLDKLPTSVFLPDASQTLVPPPSYPSSSTLCLSFCSTSLGINSLSLSRTLSTP